MQLLHIKKLSPTIVRFVEDFTMFFGSKYHVVCEARDFKEDTESEATLSIEYKGSVVASCLLESDPERRGVRSGILQLGDLHPTSRYKLIVRMDGCIVICIDIMGFSTHDDTAVDQETPVDPPSPATGWMVEDLGTITTAVLTVADMTQVRVSASAMSEPLNIFTEGNPFEAYVVVVSPGGVFPFTDIYVNSVQPVWDHKDSMQIESYEWIIHIISIAGTFHAELWSGKASGAEIDPDGNLVNSMEVNS